MAISSNATGLRPGVVTSTTRPTTPYTGQIIYETDTGYLRVWDGAAWDYLSQKQDYTAGLTTGKIVQVVNDIYTTQTSSSSSTYADTGLSLSITPTSSSNKILVIVTQAGCGKDTNNTYLQLKLFRGSTEIAMFEGYGGYNGAITTSVIGSCSISQLDSPATTSSVTYKTQMASNNNNGWVYVQLAGSRSSITLMEVVA